MPRGWSIVLHDDADGKTAVVFASSELQGLGLDDSFHIGDYPLHNILSAKEEAQSDKDHGAQYEITVNNCSRFVLTLLGGLGISPSDALLSYVVDHILASGNTIADMIRASNIATMMFGNQLEDMDDTALVEWLVHFSARQYGMSS